MRCAFFNGVCRFRGDHCAWCQTHEEWRRSVGTSLPCGDDRGPFPGLGDRVEALVKPIARAIGSSCLDSNSQLKPKSPCAKVRDILNKL